ncbi:MAG TPA: permease prefix domain 2-containing transporter [Niabella sp.]|nr:permease prefix domain 2-containing transporter [Niabella sp.]HOZ97958.1 permease prefix domain 2-containing transporter [Niabella sp.]HQW15896.1 permease prefix domain 2-containing transporter [Niabella sp.]HQX21156.1 permease prefix domain 2-containing transporter [Niabella sp.]HQX40604.1 permease prefix domain 2-containing transporter [Niabella sp.]
MNYSDNKPPRIVLEFFRWFCHPDFLEEIEGDLTERFHEYSGKHGLKKAKWIFVKEVLLLFRPSLIGNIYHLTNKYSTTMSLQNKRVIFILIAVHSLLLIPLIAMQFNTGVDWKILDFLIMSVLLSGTGLLCELVLRKVKSIKGRIIFCSIVLLVFLLVWAELAVGIFGSSFAGS